MNLAFSYVTEGLEVSFRIMCKVPANSTLSWDFGDDTEASTDRGPTHTYGTAGFYTVTLTVTDSSNNKESVEQLVMVSDEGIQTHLTDSIYNLIDRYIPTDIFQFTIEDKSTYIVKWQLYIGPLVNHEILPDKYQDELAYEGLENQLIMELAAWDFLNVQLMNLLARTGDGLSKMSSEPVDPEEDPDETGRIKKITTGPTEVEYFDKYSESISSWWKYYTQALQPGGVMDELRKNLCTLAQRLEIYIPFCDPVNRLKVPWVTNHRKPGPLDGPNPTAPIKKSRSFNK